MNENDNTLREQIKDIPKKPGVYQFFDKTGTIIYVGKAKNLKNRVSSYFNKALDSGKTILLVKRIVDLKYIVVDSELDALLLENNLIKKYQPKYNIQLKDDKTYPFICLKNERFPRVFSTRNVIRDGSEYFGPYASVKMMNTLLELVRQLYPLRNCNFQLSEKNIEQKKYKVCLEYHVKNCLGPCEGLQSEEDYNASIDDIKAILKGNIQTVMNHLKTKMKSFSDELNFEKAEMVKAKIDILGNFQSKSAVVNPKIHNVDVFSFLDDGDAAIINYMKIINGSIIQGHTIELKRKLEESATALFQMAIAELRNRFESQSKEMICSIDPEIQMDDIQITVPKKGDKKSLIDLSLRNAKYYLLEKRKQIERTDPDRHKNRILEKMQNDLRLSELPTHIECFDNSNIQGTFPVAACVVFRDTKPSKKEYRHFNIKTVEGPNDFASMEEVVYRRYKRMLDEKQSLPQLIVIDGGKGQLSSAVKSLEKLNLRGQVAIVGIAKRLEEIYFPDDPLPLYIDKTSESLKIIQHLRNEAHRFGITHHRGKRQKDLIKSELTSIEGVGYQTSQQLLRKFKSVKKVGEASLEELASTVGKAKARVVYDHFHEKSNIK